MDTTVKPDPIILALQGEEHFTRDQFVAKFPSLAVVDEIVVAGCIAEKVEGEPGESVERVDNHDEAKFFSVYTRDKTDQTEDCLEDFEQEAAAVMTARSLASVLGVKVRLAYFSSAYRTDGTLRNVEQIIRKILIAHLNVPADYVTATAHLEKDLRADSLDYVEVSMAIEDELSGDLNGREIDDDKYAEVKTVADLVAHVNAHIKAAYHAE